MHYQCFPTNAVAVCKAKNAFDLVECYMLLNLYHIPVELRRRPAENITRIKHQRNRNTIRHQPMEAAERISLPHIVKVREDERLVDIKTTGNDVFGVLQSKAVALFYCQILPQVLFIVSHLNHQRDVKNILQPPVREKSHLFIELKVCRSRHLCMRQIYHSHPHNKVIYR